jgi:hypothetical protein
MNLVQLLGYQGRTEIPVALANDCQHLAAQRLGFAPVARTIASLRDQPRRTRGPIGLQQPEHLTAFEPQQLRCRRRRQPSLIQVPQHLEPRQLSIAHQPNRHPRHPPKNPRGSVISNWQRGDILIGRLHVAVA